ncbi:hypothetical protein FB451DRAFT_1385715 [Mycena latifolia]|nr:hypothetical protein FB451DRAFT_1385715 [Mycena latifolia]
MVEKSSSLSWASRKFEHLQPPFTIQDIGDTDAHLPVSATCNFLLLLRYQDEAPCRHHL